MGDTAVREVMVPGRADMTAMEDTATTPRS